MLTNDVYSEPAVGVAQISIRSRAHLPLLMLMNCVGKYQLQPYTVRADNMAGPHTVMLT